MISSQDRIKEFVASGNTNPVSLNFPFATSTDLVVTTQAGSAEPVMLDMNVDYSIGGTVAQWRAGAGTIIPIDIAAGLAVRVERFTGLGQTYDPQAGIALDHKALGKALDDAAMRAQDSAGAFVDLTSRAIQFPRGEAAAILPPAALRAGKFLGFSALGAALMLSGTGVDSSFRDDIASVNGAALMGFLQDGAGAVLQSMEFKARERLSVRDYGAIGDGTSHPVSEWIPWRFGSLAAIQAIYPDVRSLDDEIDFAAMNRTYRHAIAQGKACFFPAGVYRGWLNVFASDSCILGEGSSVTCIKLPDGALREVPNNNDGSGPMTEGVPCVIDFNVIGYGNTAPALSGAHISGLTIDGNVDNTDVPDADLHGWGMSFTAYSNVSYHDIYVVNTHCGGVGTFINSNYHQGAAIVENCGHSNVDGATRPGFDVNSSKYSNWGFVAKDCAYGGRLLDNCFGNTVHAAIHNATLTGFVYGNQSVNYSTANDLIVACFGGCADYGMVVGAKCFASNIRIATDSIGGYALRTVGQVDPAHDSKGNSYAVASRRSGQGAAFIEQRSDSYKILSTEDGRSGGQGAYSAVDIYGDDNQVEVNYSDTDPWKVNGVRLRATSSNNEVTSLRGPSTGTPFLDEGTGNIWRGRTPVWIAPALLNSFANVGGDYFNVGYYKDADGWVHLRGLVNGGTAGNQIFVLPAGFRPLKNWIAAFGGGSGAGGAFKLQIGLGGDVVPQGGADFFALDGISFPTKS